MGIEKLGILKGCYKGKGKLPKIYITWSMMKQRCYNKKHIAYKRYGGRGILVSAEWMDFENFYNDMNDIMEEHIKKCGKMQTTLDRMDNNKGYSKENCKWSTRKEQGSNMRSNIFVDIFGITKTVSQWKRDTGIDVKARIMSGVKEKDLLTHGILPRKISEAVWEERAFFIENIELLCKCKERWVDIIKYKINIDGDKPRTLEETGKEFNLSRERIRQIIANVRLRMFNKLTN